MMLMTPSDNQGDILCTLWLNDSNGNTGPLASPIGEEWLHLARVSDNSPIEMTYQRIKQLHLRLLRD
jgi:hypothetical protein